MLGTAAEALLLLAQDPPTPADDTDVPVGPDDDGGVGLFRDW